MKNVVYMSVTNDEYELPVAIADSAAELACIVGVSSGNVRSSICCGEKGRYKSRYIRVFLEEEDEDMRNRKE